MPNCGCGNQVNSGGSHFKCSEDYTHRRIAPMIVNNIVSYDNKAFIDAKTIKLVRRKYRIGMIFNNKTYKLSSSHSTDNKKQIKFNHAENDTSNNNIKTNIPLANLGIFNKSKLLFNSNKSQSSLNESTYGKNFSQERYLMKKKKNNFLCQNQKFIC